MKKTTKRTVMILMTLTGMLTILLSSVYLKGILESKNNVLYISMADQQVAKYRGIIFAPEFKTDAREFIRSFELFVTEALVPTGINLVIFDMHWNNYHFTSIPELDIMQRKSSREITKSDAVKLANICRRNGIYVMVGMNFLTHQDAGQLLKAFPELQWPGNRMLWNPLNKQVNPIAFKMADELIDAFNPVGFHVGMDEGHGFDVNKLPGAMQYTSAELFALEINRYHEFLVEEKGIEMLMWADMLEGRYADAPVEEALSMIPKDIILVSWDYLCNWRYPWLGELIERVIPMCPYNNEWPRKLAEKGFRVMVSPWKNPGAALALAETTTKIPPDKLTGVLYTTWSPNVVHDLSAALIGEPTQRELDPTLVGVAKSIKRTIGIFNLETSVGHENGM